MRRNILLFISLCVVGCAMMYAQQMPGLLQKGKADTQDCKAWVDEQLSEMSLKEKIGQLFIHTVAPLQTQRNKNNIYAAIKEYKVGGLLFSSGQLSNQVLLTNYAQSLAEVPLFITFDGEWGLAMRLKGTPRFPRNRVLGCIQDNELLYEYGKEVARQCKEIGVQINFAPVADVDVNLGIRLLIPVLLVVILGMWLKKWWLMLVVWRMEGYCLSVNIFRGMEIRKWILIRRYRF